MNNRSTEIRLAVERGRAQGRAEGMAEGMTKGRAIALAEAKVEIIDYLIATLFSDGIDSVMITKEEVLKIIDEFNTRFYP